MKKYLLLLLLIAFAFTCQAQIKLNVTNSGQRLIELSIIKSAWISLHPGLYRYNTSAQIEN